MEKLPKGFTAAPQGEKTTVTIDGFKYNVLAFSRHGKPLLDIKMMSDERWNELCDEQDRKRESQKNK